MGLGARRTLIRLLHPAPTTNKTSLIEQAPTDKQPPLQRAIQRVGTFPQSLARAPQFMRFGPVMGTDFNWSFAGILRAKEPRQGSTLDAFAQLCYRRQMRQRGPLYKLRSAVAALFGAKHEDARNGLWWEVDLLLLLMVGSALLGVLAWAEFFSS